MQILFPRAGVQKDFLDNCSHTLYYAVFARIMAYALLEKRKVLGDIFTEKYVYCLSHTNTLSEIGMLQKFGIRDWTAAAHYAQKYMESLARSFGKLA